MGQPTGDAARRGQPDPNAAAATPRRGQPGPEAARPGQQAPDASPRPNRFTADRPGRGPADAPVPERGRGGGGIFGGEQVQAADRVPRPNPAATTQPPAVAPPPPPVRTDPEGLRRGAHDMPSGAAPGAGPAGTQATGQVPVRGRGSAGPGPDLGDAHLAIDPQHAIDPHLDDPGAQGLLREDLDEDYDDYDDGYDDGLDIDEPGGRSLSQSVVVGVALAALVFVTLGLGAVPTMILIGVLTLLAVMELFNAMRVAGLRPATLLGLVGAVALPAATFVRGDAGYPLVVGLAVVFGMLWYLSGADTERPVLNLGLTLTGVMWVGGLAGFAALMLRADDGVGLLLATIIITAASDTLAYLGGRAYGTKSFHSASPNKTWEGTLTGFFGALFAGLVIGVTDLINVFNGEFISVMVVAAVVGVLAPIGDLAESLVKRDLGIKDMGTLLPGHGGVLDRVDGLLFALPGAYYVAVVYQLI